MPTQYQAALLLVQCKVRTGAQRLTVGMRFAWFLVAFLASVDRWVAIFNASFDLVSVYALNFLALVFCLLLCISETASKRRQGPTQNYRGFCYASWSFFRFARWFLRPPGPWCDLSARISAVLCAYKLVLNTGVLRAF